MAEDRFMLLLRMWMVVCRQTKLEAKLKICRTVVDVKTECCLARSLCPDIDHLPEAPEEEGFLCAREGGGGVHDAFGLGRSRKFTAHGGIAARHSELIRKI